MTQHSCSVSFFKKKKLLEIMYAMVDQTDMPHQMESKSAFFIRLAGICRDSKCGVCCPLTDREKQWKLSRLMYQAEGLLCLSSGAKGFLGLNVCLGQKKKKKRRGRGGCVGLVVPIPPARWSLCLICMTVKEAFWPGIWYNFTIYD